MDNRISMLVLLSIVLFAVAVIFTTIAGVPLIQSLVWNSLSAFDIIYYILPVKYASTPLIFLASMLDVFVFALMAVWLAGMFFKLVRSIDIQKRTINSKIKKLNSHIIITPFNSFADQLIKRLNTTNLKYVVITEKEKTAELLLKEGVLTVINEPSSVDTFIDAGIEKAKFVVLCSNDDAQNIIISMAAKAANRRIPIISRIADINNISHMNLAGAYKIVAPEEVSGKRLAEEVVKNIV